MDFRPDPQELAQYDLEAAQFLARCEKRAKGSGGAGCLCSVGAAILLGAMGALDSMGGFAVLVIGTFVLFGVFAKRAVRQSVDDFQHTFRAAHGLARRDQALQYLWSRAQGAGAKTPAGKAAKDLLDQLGVRTRPTAGGPGVPKAPEPEVVVEAAPKVPPPVAAAGRPTSAPRHGERSHGSSAARPASHGGAPAAHDASRAGSASTSPTPPKVSTPARAPSAPAPATRAESTPSAAGGAHVASTPPSYASVPAGSTPPAAPPPGASLGAAFPAVERVLRCEFCGTERSAPAGSAPGLCPSCYPQIRLEG
ncbi:MAG: hypothetical protein IPJ77_11685 [Planctomycetes bacterium]|nr:hypothetical protein [Planctomycetota bacterium]